MIPLLIRNTRLIPALAIPTGVPMTIVNEQREKTLLATDKTRRLVCIVQCCDIICLTLVTETWLLHQSIEFNLTTWIIFSNICIIMHLNPISYSEFLWLIISFIQQICDLPLLHSCYIFKIIIIKTHQQFAVAFLVVCIFPSLYLLIVVFV